MNNNSFVLNALFEIFIVSSFEFEAFPFLSIFLYFLCVLEKCEGGPA